MDILQSTWPWYISGPLFALIMLSLIYFGNSFGVSRNLRTICSMTGIGKNIEYFKFDWKSQIWNLVFLLGVIVGSYCTIQFLDNGKNLELSTNAIIKLEQAGFKNVGQSLAPQELFGTSVLQSPLKLCVLLLGGIMIGFGTRYASGCTSGHAISGLSNLQLPSLIAVIGFFLGGLVMVHLIFPFLLPLII